MAKQTVTQLIDDLDGSEASQSVAITYKGKTYSLDLNDENASELDDALAPYIAAAEKAGGVQGGRGGKRAARSTAKQGSGNGGDADPKDVRAWAEANGVTVSSRGRISARSSSSTLPPAAERSCTGGPRCDRDRGRACRPAKVLPGHAQPAVAATGPAAVRANVVDPPRNEKVLHVGRAA